MAKNTPIPCPTCGSKDKEPCVRGKIGSVVWKRKLPYSPGHTARWVVNGRDDGKY